MIDISNYKSINYIKYNQMNDQIDNSDEIIIENLDDIPESETRDIIYKNDHRSKEINKMLIKLKTLDPGYDAWFSKFKTTEFDHDPATLITERLIDLLKILFEKNGWEIPPQNVIGGNISNPLL